MTFQDLAVTPLLIILLYFLASIYVNKNVKKSYRNLFYSALTIKLSGAILLGFVYQFYYGGGDTFNYWQNGSKWIWEAFINDPISGLQMIFGDAADPKHFDYYSRIMLRRSEAAMFVIKVSGFFDLFTFHTYSATALFFALFSFTGSWFFFTTLSEIYHQKSRLLFYAIFLSPTVIIWGSGLLKDSLTLGALLVIGAILLQWMLLKRRKVIHFLILFFCAWLLYKIKIYVLICFLPVAFILIFFTYLNRIRSNAVKYLFAPFLAAIFIAIGGLTTTFIASENERYSIEKIPEWTMITAYDLGYWTGADAGSGYSLGELDGTWNSMVTKIFPAINVTLFRPYLWESSSLLMAISAIESTVFLSVVLYLLLFKFKNLYPILTDPLVIAFLVFSLTFAFAVGVSTYNFGTLSRYKIPLIPFFLVFLSRWYQPKSLNKA